MNKGIRDKGIKDENWRSSLGIGDHVEKQSEVHISLPQSGMKGGEKNQRI